MLHKKPENSTTKIFATREKAYGHKVAGFYIIDVLLSSAVPLSISQIRKKVHRNTGYIYSADVFRSSINCLANLQHFRLSEVQVKEGRTIIRKFSLTINNTDNETIEPA